MTPVEERIDHEEAKRIAEDVSKRALRLDSYSPDMRIYHLARTFLDALDRLHTQASDEGAE